MTKTNVIDRTESGRRPSLLSDLRVLWRLAFARVRGDTQGERLESFYRNQATDYDSFRARLLHGRDGLFRSLDLPPQSVWVDLGAGTGENAERWGDQVTHIRRGYLVDLCPSLLHQAEERRIGYGWHQFQTVLADATQFRPPAPVDVVTFSYSLTMIPDWFAAVDNAFDMLHPGGLIGVTDFHVARKHPENGRVAHRWWTRHFWPIWFAIDNVFPSSDHLPYLQRKFETVQLTEASGSIPWMPFARAPYYCVVGRKPDGGVCLDSRLLC